MINIVGVRFRNAGKVYYFDPKKFQIKKGDHVIVETARGVEYGLVVANPREIEDDKVIQPLKAVMRVANAEDDARVEHNRAREKDAMRICAEKIRKHNLDMKLIDAEYTFDNNKVLFYFTADGRIDFRDLVKDLAAVFKTRIELRQIGVRDETKIIGGVGICGRPLCCHTFLSDFAPVSIKMAKEQNLSLNPTKISGVCGRLMCCLKNEEETYEYLNSRLPGTGDRVTTDDGFDGEVSSVSVLRQMVKVIVEVEGEKEIREYEVGQLKFKPRRRREKGGKGNRSEENDVKQLEELEKPEKPEKSERSERPQRPARGQRQDRADKSEGAVKTERPERSERAEKSERPEKSEKTDRSERPEKSDRPERRERRGRERRDYKDHKEHREHREYKDHNKDRREKREGKPKPNGDETVSR